MERLRIVAGLIVTALTVVALLPGAFLVLVGVAFIVIAVPAARYAVKVQPIIDYLLMMAKQDTDPSYDQAAANDRIKYYSRYIRSSL
jgi:hypothetical protein